jgi:uncharacterized protein (DUF58 family)
METVDILKKVRYIEIKTRGLTQQIFSGKYHSAFKGTGMAFSEVRAYSYGDDVRSIDWKVTARYNQPYIKIFEEERELTVLLLIDVSASNSFGSKSQLKSELITELSSVLAFSAIQNNDKVGVVFFSSVVEKFIPPKKGTSHILRIIREMLDFKPQHQGTRIASALEFLNNTIKKRSIVFLISDFFDTNYEESFGITKRKHDLIALRIEDSKEQELPPVGFVQFADPETGQKKYIDTDSFSTRLAYKKWWIENTERLKTTCSKTGTDMAVIQTGIDYVRPLLQLFRQREKRR